MSVCNQQVCEKPVHVVMNSHDRSHGFYGVGQLAVRLLAVYLIIFFPAIYTF